MAKRLRIGVRCCRRAVINMSEADEQQSGELLSRLSELSGMVLAHHCHTREMCHADALMWREFVGDVVVGVDSPTSDEDHEDSALDVGVPVRLSR